MIRLPACLLAALSLAGLSAPAFAHVSFETGTAAIGAGYKGVLRIPHGCDGQPTTSVSVTIPEGFFDVRPMPHAGWTLETVTGAYEHTYQLHGESLGEGVKEITWSGGELPDAHYDEFVFTGTFAPDLAPGPLAFPTVQTCAAGQQVWDGTSRAAPAPRVELMAAPAGMDEHAQHGEAASAPVHIGDIEISGGFSRATLPNAPTGGGFLTITNRGGSDDRLVAASADFAAEAQLHEMAMENDVMKMRQLADGIPVPAGATVTLAPGGLHLMFFQLKHPLVEGETVTVTLTFEKAGTVAVPLTIAGAAASGAHH